METRHEQAASEMWRAHSDDERAAIRSQQQSAGATHRPVQGPAPYGSEALNLLARRISADERERCAQALETCTPDANLDNAGQLKAAAALLRSLGDGRAELSAAAP